MKKTRFRRPEAPFLEFSFYFSDTSGVDSLERLVRHFLERGSGFAGFAFVARSPGLREEPFASVMDPVPQRIGLTTAELLALLTDPNVRVCKVELEGVTGLVDGVLEYAALLSSRVLSSHHAVAIWTDGSVFTGPPERPRRSFASVWRRAEKRFLEIVADLHPAYATLDVENPPETPEGLARTSEGSGSTAFSHVFLSSSWLAAEALARISRLAASASVLSVPGGLYVTTRDADLDADARFTISKGIGREIARLAKRS